MIVADFRYIKLGGKYSPVVESMNCTTLENQAEWIDNMDLILEKHPHVKLIILLGSEAWISYFSQTDEKYKELPVYCLMTQRYGATLNTPRITTVYQENTDAKSQVDMLQFMKGFNVKLCYYYEYGVKEDMVTSLADTCKFDYYNQAKLTRADDFNISIGQGENSYTPLQMANYMFCGFLHSRVPRHRPCF